MRNAKQVIETMAAIDASVFFKPLQSLKNRLAKAAMSDSLGDGGENATAKQIHLYQRWAEVGAALSIIGGVQADPTFAEKPGNLILDRQFRSEAFKKLALQESVNHSSLWLQLGHAGVMAHPPISTAKGLNQLDLPGLRMW